MDKGLDRVGVNVKHQKEKMVSWNFEGVAVMLTKQSGVAKKNWRTGWAITLCLFTKNEHWSSLTDFFGMPLI